ncbi:MAG: hypothetical protein IIX07_07650 [Lachnospiraceae bacterium]|nr:hypothetical protein [Lachnospiraceae bacterium]
MNSMFLRTNRIKKWVLCIAILALCVTGAMTVMAEENTPIRLDNFTGQTVVVGGTANANKNEIPVLANCIYDTKTHMYTITVDEENDFSIISSVADGMFTNYVVTIETNIPEGLSLFRNGTLMENPDLSGLKQFGHYVLQYEGRKILEFRIVEEYTTLRSFQTPNGFQMVNVTVDGVPAEFQYDGVQLNAEGLYEVSYVCDATKVLYTFTTTVDRTAPVLALSQLDENGRSNEPVDISDREPFSTVKVTIDGMEKEATDLLKERGEYVLTISDRAGNSNTYHFKIGMYLNGSSIAFVMLLLSVVLGVIVYVIVSAKRLKVY